MQKGGLFESDAANIFQQTCKYWTQNHSVSCCWAIEFLAFRPASLPSKTMGQRLETGLQSSTYNLCYQKQWSKPWNWFCCWVVTQFMPPHSHLILDPWLVHLLINTALKICFWATIIFVHCSLQEWLKRWRKKVRSGCQCVTAFCNFHCFGHLTAKIDWSFDCQCLSFFHWLLVNLKCHTLSFCSFG